MATQPHTQTATDTGTILTADRPVLEVRNLDIGMRRKSAVVKLVDDVSFSVDLGERYGLVGESGSGKSMTLRAIAGLLPSGVEVLSGSILYGGRDLLELSASSRRALMGPEIAMIFQEPLTALNPTMQVGDQIAEGPRQHLGLSAKDARKLAVEMMRRTGIPDPARRAKAFPHELSGGLRQRIMIALALSCSPKVLLCDEPTTALDVTVQDQVLTLLADLCDDTGTSLVFVTHDLAVVAQTCSRVGVMYSGRIVEKGAVNEVFPKPHHPYTLGLIESAPDFDRPDRELVSIPGFPPNVANRGSGCVFAPRCAFAQDDCRVGRLELAELEPDRTVACLHPRNAGEALLSAAATNGAIAGRSE
ncbi:ABC transporter ATP-binding protein [Gryllotalpicola reticulitermitis]|uniref:ABC transporter ATP-binding protein n=1 Tax=Gryllotalpicola reticulitermitis TaxID=1184153 RepID=A0ABV8Q4C2_9MICO